MVGKGSEVRQQSRVTFVMRDISADMERLVGFSTENSRGVSICFIRGAFWAILSVSAQKVRKFFLPALLELVSLTRGDRPAQFAISSPGTALPPNILLEAMQWFIKN
jgi:hypothetical protein